MTITVIRNAAWVVAWDPDQLAHVYQNDVDVAFDGDEIVHVGPGFVQADSEFDGSHRLVLPGLVNLHAHPHTEPAYKGIREDHGVPQMYGTGLYERGQAFRLDTAGRAAAAELSYGELLLNGVTSIVDASAPFEGWVDLIAGSGIRGFLAPGFASARWYLDNLHELKFAWDEPAGRAAFDHAIAVIEEAERHACGRLNGIVFPAQIDTCTESLLRDAIAYADSTGRCISTHVAQSMLEFLEMVKRHGITPIQWAARIGLLGSRTILAHSIFLDSHPSTNWHTNDDLSLLADSGSSVAHCPSPFARYGVALADFGRYERAGVGLGIGTDVAPHNVIEEMRLALVLGRIMSGAVSSVTTNTVFHAATAGGADALGRPDLGRLAPGAKADIVLVDLEHYTMQPTRDPLRTLVFEAAERAITDVFVAGRHVVADGTVRTVDMNDAASRLDEAQGRMLSMVPSHDFLSRTASQIAPLSLPISPGQNRRPD